MQCKPDTPRRKILPIYYDLLAQNKHAFENVLISEHEPRQAGGGHTHTKLALKHIRAAQKDNQKMTDEDEAYLKVARQAFEDGRIPSSASKRVMDQIKKAGKSISGLRILAILRDQLDDDLLFTEIQTTQQQATHHQKEIILSDYLTKED